MEFEEILARLPHRFPILMVDRVIELKPEHSIRVLKNISSNDIFFLGHFPGRPILPGVMIVEGMAQASGLMLQSLNNQGPVDYMLGGIRRMRFMKPVRPGDQLVIDVELEKRAGGIIMVRGTGAVEGELVAKGSLTLAVRQQTP